jgi:hypothetical protein
MVSIAAIWFSSIFCHWRRICFAYSMSGQNLALRSRNGPRRVECVDLELKQPRTSRGIIREHQAIYISVVLQSERMVNFVSKSHPSLEVARIPAILHECAMSPRHAEIAHWASIFNVPATVNNNVRGCKQMSRSSVGKLQRVFGFFRLPTKSGLPRFSGTTTSVVRATACNSRFACWRYVAATPIVAASSFGLDVLRRMSDRKHRANRFAILSLTLTSRAVNFVSVPSRTNSVFPVFTPRIEKETCDFRDRTIRSEAAKLVASGKLSLPITTTYKPSQIKEAIEHSQRGGKVLLDFNYTK